MPRPPASAALVRDLNERTVLDAIRDGHPISRAEVARRSGLSKPTVSIALQGLLDAGLVQPATGLSERPRYGVLLFEPVAGAAYVLGLDIGGRFLRGAIADLTGAVRAREDVEVGDADVAAVLDAAVALTDRLVAAAGCDRALIEGVVAGAPGVIDPTDGTVRQAGNVVGLEGLRLGEALAERLAMPATVENDINLAALGEQWGGAGRGVEHFAFLSIGTGLGCGLVLSGRLHSGRHGAAGEVDEAFEGGVSSSPYDPSAAGISELAAGLAARGLPTVLRSPYGPQAVFAAAREGDVLAASVVAAEARRITAYIAAIAAVVDVELVVLGGGIGLNGDLLLPPIRAELQRRMPFPPQVAVSTLGDGPVLVGALAVGLESALERVFDRRPLLDRRAAAGPPG